MSGLPTVFRIGCKRARTAWGQARANAQGWGHLAAIALLASFGCTQPATSGSFDAGSDGEPLARASRAELEALEPEAGVGAGGVDAAALVAEITEYYDALFGEQSATHAAGDMYRMLYFGHGGTAAPALIRCLVGEQGVDLRVNLATGEGSTSWKVGRDYHRTLSREEADELSELAAGFTLDSDSVDTGVDYMDGHNLVAVQVRRAGVTSMMIGRSVPVDPRGLVHDPAENLAPLERKLLELGVRLVAGSKQPEATAFVRSASGYLVAPKAVVQQILADADLYDNERLAHLDAATRINWARFALRWGLNRAPVVIEGTVTDAEVTACQMRTATVRVDRVLVGQLGYGEVAILYPGLASVVDSDVFRYHVHFQQGRRYVFFLGSASTPTEGYPRPLCGSELTVPLKHGTNQTLAAFPTLPCSCSIDARSQGRSLLGSPLPQ